MSIYEEDNVYNKLDSILKSLKKSIDCQLPCKVLEINNNEVDVLVISNDEIEDTPIYGIPVKTLETNRAYIWLGIKKGDSGTLKVYDKSIQGYRQGSLEYDGDSRSHYIKDSCFELGFIPDPNSFIYPNSADIEIGLKDGSAKINITNGNINIHSNAAVNVIAKDVSIVGTNIGIAGSNVSLGSNTTIDGKKFLEHTHSNGNQGNPTGGVI